MGAWSSTWEVSSSLARSSALLNIDGRVLRFSNWDIMLVRGSALVSGVDSGVYESLRVGGRLLPLNTSRGVKVSAVGVRGVKFCTIGTMIPVHVRVVGVKNCVEVFADSCWACGPVRSCERSGDRGGYFSRSAGSDIVW
jgi:hypothetical protein